jgi:GT2 family glycosyltransferase
MRYLWTHSVGLGRARNAGIFAAQHDILAFTDDDMLVPSTWFGSLTRALVDAGPRAVVTGRVLPTEPETEGGFAPSTMVTQVPVAYEGRVGKDVLMGNNMAIYRTAIDNVGCFDEHLGAGSRFPSSEDNDFGFRLLEAGYRIIYVPDAMAYHRAWRGEEDYVSLRWNYGRGQGAYFAKHLSLRDRYMLHRMVKSIKNHAFQFARQTRRQRRLAYSDAVYLLGFLSGAAQWLLTRPRMR